MGSKNEPGNFDCYHNALLDEPMFILLARDPSAPNLVEDWATERQREIHRGHRPESDQAMVDEAVSCAGKMRHWRVINNGTWRKPTPTSNAPEPVALPKFLQGYVKKATPQEVHLLFAEPITVEQYSEVLRRVTAAPASNAKPDTSTHRPFLWCCHVRGPDDVYAAPDYETALAWSDIINETNCRAASSLKIEIPKSYADCLLKAAPAPWPHSAESHAEDLPKSIAGFSKPVSQTVRAGKECPICNGDCAGANPPVLNCPRECSHPWAVQDDIGLPFCAACKRPWAETSHYLGSIRTHLELLYEVTEDPRVREHVSDEVDWIDAVSQTQRHGGE